MKRPFLALTGLCLLAAGCNDAAQTNGVDAAPGALVSDFTAPSLQGLVVRDHPKGAQAVDRFETPWTVYEACIVFTNVDGTPVRDAAHFRDLADAAVNAAASDPSGSLEISSEVLPPRERRDCERQAKK